MPLPSGLLMPPPRARLLVAVVAAIVVLLFLAAPYRHNMQDTLSYSTRPLWDKPQGPATLLTHMHSASVPADDTGACQRHGWPRRTTTPPLWDATLLSTELDLFEIRLRELWDVVDRFLVLESTHSMTGSPKVGAGRRSADQRDD